MRHIRRRWIIAITTVLLGPVLSPVWGFELLYLYGLSKLRLPDLDARAAQSSLAAEAVWAVGRYSHSVEICGLWAGNYFDYPPAREKGCARGAVVRAGRLALLDTPGERPMSMHHLLYGAATVWVSRHASVDQLKAYLAEREVFGRARGVDEAARVYFGKRASELTVGETAFLAGMTLGRKPLGPLRVLGSDAVPRRDFALHLMADAGLIDAGAYAAALREELRLISPWPEGRSCCVPAE